MAAKKNTHTVYRDPDTGKVVPTKVGEKSKKYTKEEMPNPGRGDTKPEKKGKK